MSKRQKPPLQLTTAQQLGSIIKSARDIMRKDKGLNGDLDRLPMLTWILFLKLLDDSEQLREEKAEIKGERFRPAVQPPYRWRDWAARDDGVSGDELKDFINNEKITKQDGSQMPGLFAYLRSLQGEDAHDRRRTIATIFKDVNNRMLSGYLLREVINKVNGIHFNSSEEMHTLSRLYESLLKEMRDAAGDSGEFYTPRAVVRFVRPKNFLAARIPLPELEEQRRIVVRIEELTAKIEEARELRRQNAENMEKLIAAEENRIWPSESINGAPSLEEVTTYLSRGRHSEQGDSSHLLIKTQHVQMGRYVKTHMTLAPHVAAKVSPEAMVREGDLLIACSAAGCLGRVARFTDPDVKASTDTHVAIARANTDIVTQEYLYAYLKGAQGQIQLRSRERGDWMREKVGFRLTELNLADLKRVPVPLPPISEQRRIVEYLDDLQSKTDVLKGLQAETAAELDALLPSILDKAFKGEL